MVALMVCRVNRREVADSVSREQLAEKLSAKRASADADEARTETTTRRAKLENKSKTRKRAEAAAAIIFAIEGRKRGAWCRRCCLGTGHASFASF